MISAKAAAHRAAPAAAAVTSEVIDCFPPSPSTSVGFFAPGGQKPWIIDILATICQSVGDLDSPQSVDAKGYTSMVRHMLGVTEEERQVWRDQVLSTTAADFVDFADRIDTVASEGSVAAVASERAIAEANEALEEAKRLIPRQAV